MTQQTESPKFKDAEYGKQLAERSRFTEYLKSGSLYQKHRFGLMPDEFAQIVPDVLHLYCDYCKRESPFKPPSFSTRARLQPEADIGREDFVIGPPTKKSVYKAQIESRAYALMLQCAGCTYTQFTCWIEIDSKKGWARKIGQVPEPSVDVPSDVAEVLSEDARLYRRARICTNLSYGVAACAYLRRILENRIDPLLGIIRKMREGDGADEAELARIDEIAQGKVASEKIRLAGEVLPDSLKVEGDNILLLMHNELSYGIHSGDEDWCAERAVRSMRTLDFVLVELGTEQKKREARKGVLEDVKAFRREKTEREQGCI